jgi:DNA-3-methyladenine glycosylase
MNQKIEKHCYLKDPFDFVKEDLLGATLMTDITGIKTGGIITEAEVYIGAHDKACHAYPNKKTPRTEVMFDTGGKAYVFFVYGMHHQFCVTTNEKGTANAILIRALIPTVGIDCMKKRRKTDDVKNLTTGPGKLCQALEITKQLNKHDLSGDRIWIEKRPAEIPLSQIKATPRIGIAYAEEYVHKKWRFLIKNTPYVSQK